MTKPTVMVTGSAGFVGRQILAALAGMNISVRVLLREGSALPTQCPEAIEDIIYSPDIFREPTSWWKDVCSGVDTIIHAAWYAEPHHYLMSPQNLECLMGSLVMAKGAIQAKVKRIVGIGSCFEYDLSYGNLSIETPLKPLTPYAGAKAATFLGLQHCLSIEPIEFAWCRLFYLFGEGEHPGRLVPYLRERLSAGKEANLTSGDQIRDYLDVEEAGRMIADVALSDRQGAINICSAVPTTVRSLAERIADEYERRDLLRFGTRPDNLVDPARVVGIREVQQID